MRSTSVTQILPSPILPVAAACDDRVDDGVDLAVVDDDLGARTLGTKSILYSAPR